MNKHKRHYCVLALFVAVELIVRFTYMLTFNLKNALFIAHGLLYSVYGVVKGYRLVPFFQKNYPELYEKYPDIRLELTAAGFASYLSRDGVEMDEILKAEAREIRITRIALVVLIILWFLPFNMIV